MVLRKPELNRNSISIAELGTGWVLPLEDRSRTAAFQPSLQHNRATPGGSANRHTPSHEPPALWSTIWPLKRRCVPLVRIGEASLFPCI
jgi:hypothetical protein